jgi:hypothetical protein
VSKVSKAAGKKKRARRPLKPPALPPPGVPVADVLERNPVVWSMLPDEKRKQIIERQSKLEEDFQIGQEHEAQIQEDLGELAKLAKTSVAQLQTTSGSDSEDDEVRALTEAALSRKS